LSSASEKRKKLTNGVNLKKEEFSAICDFRCLTIEKLRRETTRDVKYRSNAPQTLL
jgi:hypothetical protein